MTSGTPTRFLSPNPKPFKILNKVLCVNKSHQILLLLETLKLPLWVKKKYSKKICPYQKQTKVKELTKLNPSWVTLKLPANTQQSSLVITSLKITLDYILINYCWVKFPFSKTLCQSNPFLLILCVFLWHLIIYCMCFEVSYIISARINETMTPQHF